MSDLRVIPSIEVLRQRTGVRRLEDEYGAPALVEALREEAAALRSRLRTEPIADSQEGAAALIERAAAVRLARELQPSLRRVINATGVIIHTNLGRAPLGRTAIDRLVEVAAGYSNLEYDLTSGERGTRHVHAEGLLRRLTGADAALAVNNCAAATMLALAALARGREVIVSRGELVEIGGSFRVPDVLTQSGARLREVGTTNRTRIADYALAIGDRTGAILRVHRSNFRLEGFTSTVQVEELVALGRRFSIPVIEDLGSGWIPPAGLGRGSLAGEPTVTASVAAGVDVVCFSGDKLLGGPQAGLIVGRRPPLEVIQKHPLMRALRVDKLTYAALEATLVEHLAGRASDTVPVARMASLPAEAIAVRAEIVARQLRGAGLCSETLDGASTIGGGSAPGSELLTRLIAVSLDGVSADTLARWLRQQTPPVVARILDDRVVLDLRTVAPADDPLVVTVAGGAVEALRRWET